MARLIDANNMTINEIQSALKFDMDMMLFDANTGETHPKENLKYGNEMNYICYSAKEKAIELLEELKALREKDQQLIHLTQKEFDVGTQYTYNKAIDDYRNSIKEELNRFDVKNLDTCVLFDLMDRKAEQLKGGVKNYDN